MSEAIDAPHFALLIGIGEDAHGRLLARDAQDEILPAFLRDVFAQFAQQAAGPLLLHFGFLVLRPYSTRSKKKDKQEKDKQINFRPTGGKKRREIGRRRDGQREKEKKKRPIINKSISGRVPPPFDGFTAPVMQQQQHGTCFNLTFLLWRERERVGILRERGLLLICI